MKTLVMKFGGKAVKTPKRFPILAELILKKTREYSRIAIVVSAMGNMTDQLIHLAYQVALAPPRREYDMLVSAGERISIALLAMALQAKGKEAKSFTGSQSGIVTTNDHCEARIIQVRPDRLIASLDENKIVIVAGFQGVSFDKEITTLGRGGSDTTAVALGVALNAERVEFYKDVKGIYEDDPKISQKKNIYPKLTYDEALEVVSRTGGKVLAPRAIELAKKNSIPLFVRSFYKHNENQKGTMIFENRLKPPCPYYEEDFDHGLSQNNNSLLS